MFPQVQDRIPNQLEQQASSPPGQKRSLTPTPEPHNRNLLKGGNLYHQLRDPRYFNASSMCSVLITLGLILVVLGKFLGQNTFVGYLIENSGWVAFLIGMAMFVAIVKTSLEV